VKSAVVLPLLFAVALSACHREPDRSKMTDAQLGLKPEQAAGRHLYEQHCSMCHYAYNSKSLHGPSMMGIYKKQFMPSGMPANDERVRAVITEGKRMMPGFGNMLSSQQVDQIIAYLHTL
jgi:mono/diheme cytochrome c family protein